MTQPATPAALDITREITINAPAERVFAALANPEERIKWWGAPGKFQATAMESDLRPGGQWIMRGTGYGNKPFTLRGVYRAVDRPHLLESTWIADWDDPTHASIVRFDLLEQNGVTTVRLTHSNLSPESHVNYKGWPWLLSLLQAYVQQQ